MQSYITVFSIGLAVLMLAGYWKMYEKAGYPGWSCLVPVYNIIILLRIVGLPAWYVLLYFVPVVNLFVFVYVMYLLTRSFGQETPFVVGLILLPFLFIPILGFGDAWYLGPEGSEEDYDEM